VFGENCHSLTNGSSLVSRSDVDPGHARQHGGSSARAARPRHSLLFEASIRAFSTPRRRGILPANDQPSEKSRGPRRYEAVNTEVFVVGFPATVTVTS
jgi:hypothetical protein